MGVFEKLGQAITGGTKRFILSESLVDETKDVLINVTRSFEIGRTSSITKHAVEVGAPITDNKKNNPRNFSIDFLLFF